MRHTDGHKHTDIHADKNGYADEHTDLYTDKDGDAYKYSDHCTIKHAVEDANCDSDEHCLAFLHAGRSKDICRNRCRSNS